VTLKGASGAEVASGALVSDGFFRTLGVTPFLGRDFQRGEDEPSALQTVMVSYETWQKRFGADRNVVGKTTTLNGQPFLIVGVLPRYFHFAPVGRRSTVCEKSTSAKNLLTATRIFSSM